VIKLSIHSIVDVITNSSTVIYTWQNSVKEAKELLQEILALEGEAKKVDDLFYLGVFLSENGGYAEYLSERVNEEEEEYSEGYPIDDYKKQDEYIDVLKEKIMKGEVSKPGWMKGAESKENDMGFTKDTSLNIIPIDERYSGLVEKMKKFLNSPSCDGGRDG